MLSFKGISLYPACIHASKPSKSYQYRACCERNFLFEKENFKRNNIHFRYLLENHSLLAILHQICKKIRF